MNSVTYVGMDIDKEKIVIAVLRDTERDLSRESMIRNETSTAGKYFSKLKKHG